MCSTGIPESGPSMWAAPLLETYISEQRHALKLLHSEPCLWRITHVPSWWPLQLYLTISSSTRHSLIDHAALFPNVPKELVWNKRTWLVERCDMIRSHRFIRFWQLTALLHNTSGYLHLLPQILVLLWKGFVSNVSFHHKPVWAGHQNHKSRLLKTCSLFVYLTVQ